MTILGREKPVRRLRKTQYLVPAEEGEEVGHVKLLHDDNPGAVDENGEQCHHLTVHVEERQERQGGVFSIDDATLTIRRNS